MFGRTLGRICVLAASVDDSIGGEDCDPGRFLDEDAVDFDHGLLDEERPLLVAEAVGLQMASELDHGAHLLRDDELHGLVELHQHLHGEKGVDFPREYHLLQSGYQAHADRRLAVQLTTI